MISLKKLLAATDLSDESYSALEYASGIASDENAAVTLLL